MAFRCTQATPMGRIYLIKSGRLPPLHPCQVLPWLPPIRPRIRADDPTSSTYHPRPERRHRQIVGPRLSAQDRPVPAVPARHVERLLMDSASVRRPSASLRSRMCCNRKLPRHGSFHIIYCPPSSIRTELFSSKNLSSYCHCAMRSHFAIKRRMEPNNGW